MASVDFENEKKEFLEFYDANRLVLENAKNSLIALINSLMDTSAVSISKIEGRIKDKEECLGKFTRKYRTDLEKKAVPYNIKDKITDLVGLRVVCLYEDEIEKISNFLKDHFEVIDITDKITEIEGTESSFGYKGLHVDLRLKEDRLKLPEYSKYRDLDFEVQIRTVVQDSWSVIDHKIKYKKSIPNRLKRRINTLGALFELADREFRAIRDATTEELELVQEYDAISEESEEVQETPPKFIYHELDAFSFQRVAGHFFSGYEFEPHKVDGFVQEIVALKEISRGKFNYYMRENISTVKRYRDYREKENIRERFNPYTVIRHCLYLGDKRAFERILTSAARQAIEEWASKLGK
jgi:putative GTP pyrophosphokinase